MSRNEPVDINARDEKGDTALHRALRDEDFKQVGELLAKKARRNIRNKQGQTPFEVENGKLLLAFEESQAFFEAQDSKYIDKMMLLTFAREQGAMAHELIHSTVSDRQPRMDASDARQVMLRLIDLSMLQSTQVLLKFVMAVCRNYQAFAKPDTDDEKINQDQQRIDLAHAIFAICDVVNRDITDEPELSSHIKKIMQKSSLEEHHIRQCIVDMQASYQLPAFLGRNRFLEIYRNTQKSHLVEIRRQLLTPLAMPVMQVAVTPSHSAAAPNPVPLAFRPLVDKLTKLTDNSRSDQSNLYRKIKRLVIVDQNSDQKAADETLTLIKTSRSFQARDVNLTDLLGNSPLHHAL